MLGLIALVAVLYVLPLAVSRQMDADTRILQDHESRRGPESLREEPESRQ